MLRRVALVGTDISDERIASIIRVTKIGELGTTLAVTSNLKHPAKKYSVRFSHKTPFFKYYVDGIIQSTP
jgi:hypothetical protein